MFYREFFAPVQKLKGPSGWADPPRPFVFRAAHLDGMSFAENARFSFDLNLFLENNQIIEDLSVVFAQLSACGLGAERRKVELVSVECLPKIELDLGKFAPVTGVELRFVTPTELKSEGTIARKPEFGILAARLRDRISALAEAYGEGPLTIDFRAFGERASKIAITCSELTHHDVSRRSSRTGQTHGLGGFVGEVSYAGDLAEFLTYLQAGQWTGVGRHTV